MGDSEEPPHQKFEDEIPGTGPRKARNMSTQEEENRLNILKTSFFLLVLLGLALGAYSWFVWKQTHSKVMIAVSLTCIATVVGSIIGIVGSFRSIAEIEFRNEIIGHEMSGRGHDILLTGFYFLIAIFILYLVFGIRALFFTEQSVSYIEALHNSDSDKWGEIYGGKSLEEVIALSVVMISISGYTCFILVVLITIIAYMVFSISVNYEAIHSVIEEINLGLEILGLSIIAMSVYCLKYRSYMELYEIVDATVPAVMIGIGALLILVSLFGYYTAKSEKISLLKAYVFACSVLIIVCIIAAILSVQNARNYKDSLQHKCSDVLALIDEDYLRDLGCERKYEHIESSEESLMCEKNDVRYIWETGHNQSKYGCLNIGCCDVMLAQSKTKFDYLGIIALSAVFLSTLAIWGCYFHLKKITVFGATPVAWHRADPRILIMMIMSAAVAILYILYGLPAFQKLPPFKDSKVQVQGATLIDSRFLMPGYCTMFSPLNLTSSMGNCEKCESASMWGTVESSTGVISYEQQTSRMIVLEGGSVKTLNEMISSAIYCEDCEDVPGAVTFKVYRKETYTDGTVQDFKVHENKVSYEYEKNTMRLWGAVFNEEGAINAGVKVRSGDCPVWDGGYAHSYTYEASLAPYSIPYHVTMQFSDDSGHINALRSQQVGGLPFYSYSLPPVVVPKPSKETGNLLLSFMNIKKSSIIEATVTIRTGYNNYTGPSMSSWAASSELPLVLLAGVYSIQGYSTGFKDIHLDLVLEGGVSYTKALLFTPDNFLENEMRVILNWNREIDLDLRANFILDEDYTCDISFNTRACGGAKLTSISAHRAEEISVRHIGAYQYLFYVKQYLGNNTDANPGILKADLHVDVYIGNWKSPIVTLHSNREYKYPEETGEDYRIWLGFCMHGLKGVSSIAPIQSYISVHDDVLFSDVCSQTYGETVEVFSTDYYAHLKAQPVAPLIPSEFINFNP